ncbi:MAG: hypothetical protein KDC27_05825 [Acidobacteria bacterium]|nr:hypothetical protein [Acidobacteriota bacterium]
MSLGWGLRGYIGGHSFGAMIPGAMVALVLCRLLRISGERAALAAAFGAIGIGFGGEMTYGQTVGFARDGATLTWGLTGLALKGAVWGLTGGVFVAAGFAAVPLRRLAVALAAFVAAVLVGWYTVNLPKLIYFSNLADRPREEVWAGLLLGGLAFWLVLRDVPSIGRFALFGFVGGGLGFGLGGVWIFIGSQVGMASAPWWKLMEFTFGALFGAALGWAALALEPGRGAPKPMHSLPWPPASALAFAAFFAEPLIPSRFPYVFLGCLLLGPAVRWPLTRLPIALLATAVAFFLDWSEYFADTDLGPAALGWTLGVAATLAFAVALPRFTTTRSAFWLLSGVAVAVAMAKGAITSINAEHALFAVLTLALLAIERTRQTA